jgi:hypothetical protein
MDVLQIVVLLRDLCIRPFSAMGKEGGNRSCILRTVLSQVMFKFTSYIMLFAPFGIGRRDGR